jgi:hypothetical protein
MFKAFNLSLSIALLVISLGNAQDGIRSVQTEYYSSTKSLNYPFLTGNSANRNTEIITSQRPVANAPMVVSHQGSCCAPLLPTLTQGLRDTINALLPCRGMRGLSGRGLLFSERFYSSGCCGSPMNGQEVIIEPAGQQPTPATPDSVPETVEPEIIDDSVLYRRIPKSTPTVNNSMSRDIRTISGNQVIIRSNPQQDVTIPINPLRR